MLLWATFFFLCIVLYNHGRQRLTYFQSLNKLAKTSEDQQKDRRIWVLWQPMSATDLALRQKRERDCLPWGDILSKWKDWLLSFWWANSIRKIVRRRRRMFVWIKESFCLNPPKSIQTGSLLVMSSMNHMLTVRLFLESRGILPLEMKLYIFSFFKPSWDLFIIGYFFLNNPCGNSWKWVIFFFYFERKIGFKRGICFSAAVCFRLCSFFPLM